MTTPPSVLMSHCYYRQRGGEDVCFETEAAMLEARGHRVTRFTRHNTAISDSAGGRLRTARDTVWSSAARSDLRAVLTDARPDVVHFQNTFPLISPAAYGACRDIGVPVVQTVHNYRLRCVNGLLYRDGAPCEDCVGHRVAAPGVLHRCYRGSAAGSAVVAMMLGVHWTVDTWRLVDRFIALTQFARDKLVEFGLPANRIAVKPNFVYPDPGARDPDVAGDHLLYIGRLTPEKGLWTLLAAAERVPDVPLLLVGSGPIAEELQAAVTERRLHHVRLLGQRGPEEIASLLREARALVMPSEWYETFGRVVIEAYACGTPVIANRIGAVAELVEPEVTGLQTVPGDVDDLVGAFRRARDEHTAFKAMGAAARRRFEDTYAIGPNYAALMDIYRQASEG